MCVGQLVTAVLLHFLRVTAQMCNLDLAKNGARPQTVTSKPPGQVSVDKRQFYIKRQTLILIFGLGTILTSCLYCTTACSSEIRNESSHDIYVILTPADNKDVKVYKPFVDASKVSKFKLDTLGNIGTFIIPPGGHLLTYDGPGNNPAKLLGYLKIITDKQIIEFQTQDKIKRQFDQEGVVYSMTIKEASESANW